ncbi:nitrilase/cyanide hydratase and apolipoprotein N-acyltransferase [Natrialba chahannaoensis JCM 10990]|uniref:Nitrilase/cyanide hydratase and apolipoprotein N-acyltransferase n=1 Tax=Natrialba chahannaoensis JCM 10990 TaxID=1227492 RepID=M0AXB4_9EURY|nr:hypothetical protein [Natrialba chahannaoensis]ELZ02967.1 nitrilase/cyanide hydratase and apolipoprotein N-acyltransferase [Natrialba chahannaoensis JCM 10990]
MTDASSDTGTRTEADAGANADTAFQSTATDAQIVVAQTTPAFGEIERNREHTVALVREHADADLIVLPELATSGYVFESESELAAMAEPRLHGLYRPRGYRTWHRVRRPERYSRSERTSAHRAGTGQRRARAHHGV